MPNSNGINAVVPDFAPQLVKECAAKTRMFADDGIRLRSEIYRVGPTLSPLRSLT